MSQRTLYATADVALVRQKYAIPPSETRMYVIRIPIVAQVAIQMKYVIGS